MIHYHVATWSITLLPIRPFPLSIHSLPSIYILLIFITPIDLIVWHKRYGRIPVSTHPVAITRKPKRWCAEANTIENGSAETPNKIVKRHNDSLFGPSDEQDLELKAMHKGRHFSFISEIIGKYQILPHITEEEKSESTKAHFMLDTFKFFEGGKNPLIIMECLIQSILWPGWWCCWTLWKQGNLITQWTW